MDLKSEVRIIMQRSPTALTVDQVAQELAERLKGDIRF
jgi:hypothetical protein